MDITAIFYLFTHLLPDHQQKRTYTASAAVTCVTMARVTGERAPAFTSGELERLVDEVLPQYRMLYGPPDQQVSTPPPRRPSHQARVVRTQPSTSATQSRGTVVSTATPGEKGSRAPGSHTDRVPVPSAAWKGKETPPAAAKNGKEAPPAGKRKGKEQSPAAKRKGKEQSPAAAKRSNEPHLAAGRRGKGPAPAGKKDKRPCPGTQSELPAPTMVVQPSEAAGDGLDLPGPPPAPPPAAAAPVSSLLRLQGKGWSLPPPLLAPPPAPLPTAATPVGSCPRL
ncbi:hypothetical protein NDU88_003732 [Pleurodeles waltl]|uniref:Uncharacterized protein n=1 Tax=Pleurodeles waltl TaxID=8319 RepID=A0AAV7W6F8_PLEWA|nr:hypothetical protein NDU88_003732 [Pleurodeles waltl]